MAAENDHGEHSEKHASGGHGGGHGGGGHGGGGHEEHEGAPEWLISFADNTALMMGFFVIMLALAMSSQATKASASGGESDGENEFGGMTVREIEWTLGVRDAFNNPVQIDSTDPREAILVAYLKKKNAGFSDAASEGLKGREHDVESIRRTGIFGAGGGIRFTDGSADLTEDALSAIAALGEQFKGTQTRLDIRGHCSAAEAFQHDDRGMRLSYERAMAIARGLAELGLDWRRMRVTGCADGDRLTETAYDAEAHGTNQRVEVLEVGGASSPLTP